MHDMSPSENVSVVARSVLDTCLCHNARMAARVITRAYDEALRPTGLRATQVSVLAAVAARGALSIKALADSLQMERTTLKRNLGPLEDQGYVALAPERRHRSRVITLTPSGQTALLEALPLWRGAQRSAQKQLGERRWPAVQKAFTDLIKEVQRAPAA